MRKRLPFILTLSIVLITVASLSVSAKMDRKKRDELYRQVELFSDALAIIQSEYVDEAKPKELIYGALKGMLSSLDPYSQFMDQETYNELKVETEGAFGGIGIEIAIKDELLTVITPIEDTPAWRAGIKAKDIIVKINNELTRGMSIADAVKKMRGKPGTQVTLTILRQSEKKILEFKIVRDIIKIKDIKEARILDDGIGYIRLVEFRENSGRDVDNAIANLSKQGMKALILDLRNNPGGLLESAVKVAELFVEKEKLIVYTRGRKPNQNMDFVSRITKPATAVPIAVLVNDGSASGSEIVAACLQDYGRAIIVGTKSFGKGSVQSVFPLGDGSALRLTTSKFFTPSGKVINEKGVVPDVVVEEEKNKYRNPEVSRDEDINAIFEEIENKEKPSKEEETFNYQQDNQIMAAMNILK
ncbi:MAG: S41 family peptidase, partial [Candidatus Omnitrophica bacterium]|nr:S41 family peptidase [Candidatus Omnitrophota bacterium]